MYRCKWKCIGEDDQQVCAPRLMEKYLGNGDGKFLQNKGDDYGYCDCKEKACIEKLSGFLVFSLGHTSGDTAGKGKLNTGTGKGKAQCVDWKYKLIQAHAFLSEGVA